MPAKLFLSMVMIAFLVLIQETGFVRGDMANFREGSDLESGIANGNNVDFKSRRNNRGGARGFGRVDRANFTEGSNLEKDIPNRNHFMHKKNHNGGAKGKTRSKAVEKRYRSMP